MPERTPVLIQYFIFQAPQNEEPDPRIHFIARSLDNGEFSVLTVAYGPRPEQRQPCRYASRESAQIGINTHSGNDRAAARRLGIEVQIVNLGMPGRVGPPLPPSPAPRFARSETGDTFDATAPHVVDVKIIGKDKEGK